MTDCVLAAADALAEAARDCAHDWNSDWLHDKVDAYQAARASHAAPPHPAEAMAREMRHHRQRLRREAMSVLGRVDVDAVALFGALDALDALDPEGAA